MMETVDQLNMRANKMLKLAQRLKQDTATSCDAGWDQWIDQCTEFVDCLKSEGSDTSFLAQLREIVKAHIEVQGFGIDDLCDQLGISRTHLHRKVKAGTGLSSSLYIRQIRLEKAKSLLETSDQPVSQIAFAVGFNNAEYFSRKFSEAYGCPPSAYSRANMEQ